MHKEVPSRGDELVQSLSSETSSSRRNCLHPLPYKLYLDHLPQRDEPRKYGKEEEGVVISPEPPSAKNVSSRQETRLYSQVLKARPSSQTTVSTES